MRTLLKTLLIFGSGYIGISLFFVGTFCLIPDETEFLIRNEQSGDGNLYWLDEIARILIEAHGRHVWVELLGSEKGSVSTFTLPIGKEE